LKSQAATPKLSDLGVTKTQSSRWQHLAAMPADRFEQHVAAAKRQAVNSLSRAETADEKKARRAEREQRLAERTAAAATSLNKKIYGVILADPPWRWEPYSRQTGMDRSADNHYPTMTTEAIKTLEIPAADDCVLFLWATVAMLPQALEVMTAWGFAYRSACAWVKDKPGTGYWFRSQFELLLVGTKGSIPAPAPGDQCSSVISAPRGRHSKKPEAFYGEIDRMFPNLPKLEMFARGEAGCGWDYWGNEAGDLPMKLSDARP